MISGLGATQLPYSCTASICYGIGSYHQTILQMQNAINRYVALVPSLKAIAVDGKIGAGTVTALKAIKDWMPTNAAPYVALVNASISKETAAASAASLASLLSSYVGASSSVPPVVTQPSTPSSSSSPVPSLPPNIPDLFTPPSGASNKKWYVLGALALAGVGGLAYWNYRENAR